MRQQIRQSGIDLIGEVPWGTHLCQFYQTGQDLLDILVPYFQAGLDNNEFCMWVTSQPVGEVDAREALRKAVPDLDQYLGRGQIEIIPYDEWYTKGGNFDQQRVLDGWVDKLHGAMARGYDGLRLTGNTFWLEKKDWRSFTDYERAVDSVIGGFRMIAICTYQADKCGVAEVADVISNHQFALIKRHGGWEVIESAASRRRIEELAIEAQRQAESASQRAAELDAANKELEAFSYSVSHDLRAPLRGIDGLSLAVLEDYADKLDTRGQRYLRQVRSETQHMGRLIDDLLVLSRVTRQEIRREWVDLSRLAGEIAAGLLSREPNRRVEFAISPDLVVHGDSRLLRLALENLLSNAWKYTSKHESARVEVGKTTRDGREAYFVRDDGAGFDVAYADKLFGAFQRLHGETEFPGSGIGLATVQRIVHRHGGQVWAEGAIEQGATFYFTL